MFGTTVSQTVTTLLLGIPESLGLLLFGIGLAANAIFIRWFLGRNEIEKTEGKRR